MSAEQEINKEKKSKLGWKEYKKNKKEKKKDLEKLILQPTENQPPQKKAKLEEQTTKVDSIELVDFPTELTDHGLLQQLKQMGHEKLPIPIANGVKTILERRKKLFGSSEIEFNHTDETGPLSYLIPIAQILRNKTLPILRVLILVAPSQISNVTNLLRRLVSGSPAVIADVPSQHILTHLEPFIVAREAIENWADGMLRCDAIVTFAENITALQNFKVVKNLLRNLEMIVVDQSLPFPTQRGIVVQVKNSKFESEALKTLLEPFGTIVKFTPLQFNSFLAEFSSPASAQQAKQSLHRTQWNGHKLRVKFSTLNHLSDASLSVVPWEKINSLQPHSDKLVFRSGLGAIFCDSENRLQIRPDDNIFSIFRDIPFLIIKNSCN